MLLYVIASHASIAKLMSQPIQLPLDHVLPISRGGKTNWENIVAACGPCNGKKGSDTYMKPIREPYKPGYYELAQIRKSLPFDIKHPSWKDYLS